MKKEINTGFRIADKTLKFFEDQFNIEDGYHNIVINLENQAMQLENIKAFKEVQQANRLIQTQKNIMILDNDTLMSQVNDITAEIGLDDNTQVVRLTDKLIYDIGNAHDWLNAYKKFINNVNANVQGQLKALGIAILGRAIELCPIDTGFLRKSGIVVVNDNSVVISFTAPYALYVHENVNARHKVGQAKFLEVAVQEFMPNKFTWIQMVGDKSVAVKISTDYHT